MTALGAEAQQRIRDITARLGLMGRSPAHDDLCRLLDGYLEAHRTIEHLATKLEVAEALAMSVLNWQYGLGTWGDVLDTMTSYSIENRIDLLPVKEDEDWS